MKCNFGEWNQQGRPVKRTPLVYEGGLVSCYPTIATKTKTSRRWGTRSLLSRAIPPIPQKRGMDGALGIYVFMAFYALGPGVVVWLALSELMPTRIRSNGMSIALVINQLMSTALAAIFLPFVSKHGYSSMFLLFAGFTVVYFAVAAFLLPETKGKTLEEIEARFEGRQVSESAS